MTEKKYTYSLVDVDEDTEIFVSLVASMLDGSIKKEDFEENYIAEASHPVKIGTFNIPISIKSFIPKDEVWIFDTDGKKHIIKAIENKKSKPNREVSPEEFRRMLVHAIRGGKSPGYGDIDFYEDNELGEYVGGHVDLWKWNEASHPAWGTMTDESLITIYNILNKYPL